jgi:hypothetical protein
VIAERCMCMLLQRRLIKCRSKRKCAASSMMACELGPEIMDDQRNIVQMSSNKSLFRAVVMESCLG